MIRDTMTLMWRHCIVRSYKFPISKHKLQYHLQVLHTHLFVLYVVNWIILCNWSFVECDNFNQLSHLK